MDEIICYKMCAVKVRNAKLQNYLKTTFAVNIIISSNSSVVSVPTSNQFVLLYILRFFLKLNRII
jgi:hypothetical protein